MVSVTAGQYSDLALNSSEQSYWPDWIFVDNQNNHQLLFGRRPPTLFVTLVATLKKI